MTETKKVKIKAEKVVEVPLTEYVDTEEEIKRMAKTLGAFSDSDIKAGERPGRRIHEDQIEDIEIMEE